MEPEGSLPHLQNPNACSHFETDQSSPGRYRYLCRDIFNFKQCDIEDYKPDPEVKKT